MSCQCKQNWKIKYWRLNTVSQSFAYQKFSLAVINTKLNLQSKIYVDKQFKSSSLHSCPRNKACRTSAGCDTRSFLLHSESGNVLTILLWLVRWEKGRIGRVSCRQPFCGCSEMNCNCECDEKAHVGVHSEWRLQRGGGLRRSQTRTTASTRVSLVFRQL